MIEHTVTDLLLADFAIQEYCGNKVYAIAAPEGTKAPFVVINEKDTRNIDDIIAIFDLTIEIYDFDKDKRPIIQISQVIKNLLNFYKTDDPYEQYSSIRFRFNSRQHFKESDTTLTRMFMSFSARACEEVTK